MNQKTAKIMADLQKQGIFNQTEDQLAQNYLFHRLSENCPKEYANILQKRISLIFENTKLDTFAKRVFATTFVVNMFKKSTDVETTRQEQHYLSGYMCKFLAHKFGLNESSEEFIKILACSAELLASEMGIKPEESKKINFGELNFNCNVCKLRSDCEKHNYDINKCYILDFSGINTEDIVKMNSKEGFVCLTQKQEKRMRKMVYDCRESK
jgi:hypothetical protein